MSAYKHVLEGRKMLIILLVDNNSKNIINANGWVDEDNYLQCISRVIKMLTINISADTIKVS